MLPAVLFAFIQVLLLPGIIFLKIGKIKLSGIIEYFLYSMGLSLYFNYIIVCSLTLFGIYTSVSIYILLFLEVLALTYLIFKPGIKLFQVKHPADIYKKATDYFQKLSSVQKLVFSLSCFTLLFYVSVFLTNAGTVFYFNDAVSNWNRWAAEWAANNFPVNTAHYPQLLPANWSLFYVFAHGSTLQILPKMLAPVFPIAILLMLLDLGAAKKRYSFPAGLIIYGSVSLIFYSILFIADGNADIPVSFFGFLTFYTILKQEGRAFNQKTVILSVIFASSAADIKLAGMYILILCGLWILYSIYNHRKGITKKDMVSLAAYILLVIGGSLFWYVIKPNDMYMGLDQSPFLLSNYFDRFMNAVYMLINSLSLPVFLFLLITMAAALKEKLARYILLSIVFPALLLWAFFFSYDFRNLSIAIPFIAYASGAGLEVIYKITGRKGAEAAGSVSSIRAGAKSKYIVISVLVLSAGIFIFADTSTAFNFLMGIAGMLSKVFFNHYRVIYTTELGYYRLVEFYIEAIRWMCILIPVILAVRYRKVKLQYIVSAAIIAGVILNFTIFKMENLLKIQADDMEKIKAHNLLIMVNLYTRNTPGKDMILTDYEPIARLKTGSGMEIRFADKINAEGGNINYYLLKKNMKGIVIPGNRFKVCMEDDEFFLLSSGEQLKIKN